jgi:hypothetical protein
LSLTEQKVGKNKDDARILLESVVTLIVVIRDDVRRHGDLCETRYAGFCKVFATSVFDVIVQRFPLMNDLGISM